MWTEEGQPVRGIQQGKGREGFIPSGEEPGWELLEEKEEKNVTGKISVAAALPQQRPRERPSSLAFFSCQQSNGEGNQWFLTFLTL